MFKTLATVALAAALGSLVGGCSGGFAIGQRQAPTRTVVADSGPPPSGHMLGGTVPVDDEIDEPAGPGGRRALPCASGFKPDPALGCVGETITDRSRLSKFDKYNAGCKPGEVRTITVPTILPSGQQGFVRVKQHCESGKTARVK